MYLDIFVPSQALCSGLDSLAPGERRLSAAAHNILDKTLSCFEAHIQNDRSIETWFPHFGVEELVWPARSPDLSPIQHL